jgi:hypothetical protein
MAEPKYDKSAYYCRCGAKWSWSGVPEHAAGRLHALFLEGHTGEGHGETDSKGASRARAKADREAFETQRT